MKNVWAILRDDAFHGESAELHDRITVKGVVGSEEKAAAEVERLNNLESKPDQVRYWYQTTRLLEDL